MIQCEGCYFQDKKENVCCHENPFFDIDDNCTDYVENEFVKKIRADAIDEFVNALINDGKVSAMRVLKVKEQLKEQKRKKK